MNGIKHLAINAQITPDQKSLSSEEVEIRTAAVYLSSQAADDLEAFIATQQEELNRLTQKAVDCDSEINRRVTVSSGMNAEEVIKHVVKHVEADLENREEANAS